MNRKPFLTAAAIVFAPVFALSACGQTTGERALSGGAIGAGVGAVGSTIVGGSTVGGAVLGGVAGGVVGAVTDPETIDLGNW